MLRFYRSPASNSGSGAPVHSNALARQPLSTGLSEATVQKAIGEIKERFQGGGSVALDLIADKLRPIQDSLTTDQKLDLSATLAKYVLDNLQCGQMGNLVHLSSLAFLLQSTHVEPDANFLSTIRKLHQALPSYWAVYDICGQAYQVHTPTFSGWDIRPTRQYLKDGRTDDPLIEQRINTALHTLQSYLPEADRETLFTMMEGSEFLFLVKQPANLNDYLIKQDPLTAVFILRFCEAIVGERLPEFENHLKFFHPELPVVPQGWLLARLLGPI